MNKVAINNQTEANIDKKFIRKIALIALKDESIKNSELSVAFISNKEIRKLNKRYRKLDRAADVLSFGGDGESNFLGEIVISPAVIKQRNSRDFKKALAHALIHGVLHLLGYDHIKISDRRNMRREEDKLLKLIKSS